jgi:S-adenosylmethionine hydrolase
VSAPPLVTLLTDFGGRDGYVGAMKGVILTRCPEARIVDLGHDVPPGDVAAASFALAAAAPHFPPAVHVAVVDPGVGSARRGLALRIGEQRYVGPDNGLFAVALADAPHAPLAIHSLENRTLWRAPVSPVFHGRDVFAPVAAHLAAGGALEDVGPLLERDALAGSAASEPTWSGGALRGQIVYVDRFGNLVTNVRVAPDAAQGAEVEIAGRTLALARTYQDAPSGELVALVGSTGRLEIAVNGGSAAQRLGASVGRVLLVRAPREPA